MNILNDGSDLRVRWTNLQGFPPFPTWNGTVSSPGSNPRGLCSVLSDDGELVVLQCVDSDDSIRVLKVLPPMETSFTSFCQCWSQDGSVVAAAYDRSVVFYDTQDFHMLHRLQLQYSVTAMDVVKDEAAADGESTILLLVGTQFGALLYKVVNGSTSKTTEPVGTLYPDVAVSLVKFSPDEHTAAIGTFDGRLFLRRLGSYTNKMLASFGESVLSKVLDAPRVTSLSFSACSSKLAASTRKGNVYVLAWTPELKRWQTVSSCKELSGNPKPSKASTAQTLLCWWGPILAVCSRAVIARLELFAVESGELLRSLQLTASTSGTANSLTQWADQQLITGLCGWKTLSGQWKLMCHDSDGNIMAVQWPFMDVIAR